MSVPPLTDIEIRVLGCLVEKETTTPEYYPLSLNALVNACNQKSNREPVMALDEDTVAGALGDLEGNGLVEARHDSRVEKYAHRLYEGLNCDRREMAVLCLLMLRGPQTTGELRGRSERMYAFDDLAAVELTLDRMIAREPPLVARLPRQPGTKESRYAHLLAGEARHLERVEQPSSPPLQGDLEERVARLEAEVSELKRRLESLGG